MAGQSEKIQAPEIFGRPQMSVPSIKDERDYWSAGRNLQIDDLMNDSRLKGVVCIFGPGFCEEFPSLVVSEAGKIIVAVSSPRGE
jgi:hypothetical protein